MLERNTNNSAINIYDTSDVIMATSMHTVLEPGTSSAHLSASWVTMSIEYFKQIQEFKRNSHRALDTILPR